MFLLVWSSPQLKCPEFSQEAIWNAVMILLAPSLVGFKGVLKEVWAFHKWMRSARHVGHERQDCLTFNTSVRKFKHHRKFTVKNLTSQPAPRAARSEEMTLKLQKDSPSEEQSHPNPGQRRAFPIACYGRSALLYFLPPCSSCPSPGRTHTPPLQIKLGPRALPWPQPGTEWVVRRFAFSRQRTLLSWQKWLWQHFLGIHSWPGSP